MTNKARTHNGVTIVYSINGVGKIEQICAKKKKKKNLALSLTPYGKIKAKGKIDD